MRETMSVLLPDLTKKHYIQDKHESSAEFSGRVLCAIEAAIMGKRNTSTPAGTRWGVWHHNTPHPMPRFYANGLGMVYESTGRPFSERVRRLPGLFTESSAGVAVQGTGPKR